MRTKNLLQRECENLCSIVFVKPDTESSSSKLNKVNIMEGERMIKGLSGTELNANVTLNTVNDNRGPIPEPTHTFSIIIVILTCEEEIQCPGVGEEEGDLLHEYPTRHRKYLPPKLVV